MAHKTITYIINLLETGFGFLKNNASLHSVNNFGVFESSVGHFATSEYLPHEHTCNKSHDKYDKVLTILAEARTICPNVRFAGETGIVEHLRWCPLDRELGAARARVLIIQHIPVKINSNSMKCSGLVRREKTTWRVQSLQL
jgi:hypothetical protein